jgi:hypothetical protein
VNDEAAQAGLGKQPGETDFLHRYPSQRAKIRHGTTKLIFSRQNNNFQNSFQGGQGSDSGRVTIWNLAPVLSEKAELDPKVPKILCQM